VGGQKLVGGFWKKERSLSYSLDSLCQQYPQEYEKKRVDGEWGNRGYDMMGNSKWIWVKRL